MANPNTNILQWNCQGIRNKKDEILNMIEAQKISIIALQETKLWKECELRLPRFNCYRKDGHYNRMPHGGVSIYIHEHIPHNVIQIDTPIQAIAVRVNIGQLITICNVYSSRSHTLSEELLNTLYNQLPPPVILVGDFNGFNPLWGCNSVDVRGREIEKFITSNSLNILNSGAPTRIGYQSQSAIDLSICTPILEPILQWTVSSSPGDSDHCPIIITKLNDDTNAQPAQPRWNLSRARWKDYENSRAWSNLPELQENPKLLLEDFYNRVNEAALESIPQYRPSKFFPKPWWTREVAGSRVERERLYQKYRRDRSINNMIQWKKKRAEHKKLVIKSKKECWREFTETLTDRTPQSKIFEKIRSIRGKAQRKVNILYENNRYYSTIDEITNKLGSSFSAVSSNDNYTAQFLDHKNNVELLPIDFSPEDDEIYNRPFTLDELQQCLVRSRNTAPGIDGIHYLMIKNLPLKAKDHLLKIFNHIWYSDYFPPQWESAIIVPIPKPGKNHSSPINYRPIALTSCVCKVMERMVNERLTDYLEMNKVLSPVQCGCRRHRSTLDHLVRLESEVRRAFVKNEHVVSIFFDLEKAYDMTWRHGILIDLHSAGLRGLLPQFIARFLRHRTFQVQVNNQLSDVYTQHNGVAQGSILSVTLFALKINSVIQHINPAPNIMTSLFVDDLQLSCRGHDLNIIGGELQQRLNSIHEWANKNGFKFSISKTKIMHFHYNPGLHLPPQLRLGDAILPYADNIKYLGLTWDTKLTWKPHIAKLKADCTKLIGIIKSVTNHEWGADQSSCMKIYRSMIRSKIDYGCQVYGSAAETTLNSLNPVVTEVLRLATGAFKSTPRDSLHVLADELPLDLRREKLALRYYYKTRSIIDNPAHKHVVPLHYRNLFMNKHLPLPLSHRTQNLIERYDLRKGLVKPKFSYIIHNITVPSWSLQKPQVNFKLALPKASTSDMIYRMEFHNLCDEQYHDHRVLYTDGSKSKTGVGAAAISELGNRSASLPIEASIFSAELEAIRLAVNIVRESTPGKYVVMSDSYSVLSSLNADRYQNPTIQRLLHEISDLKLEHRYIEFCWIPGHVGIAGNELADAKAKQASRRPEEYILLPYTDWYPIINSIIDAEWQRRWDAGNQKMYQVKREVGRWKLSGVKCRRDEVVLNRLRAGHCYATHSHLMDRTVAPMASICEICNDAVLTVEHVLLKCPRLNIQRTAAQLRVNENTTLQQVIGEEAPINNLFQYIRNIGFYHNV